MLFLSYYAVYLCSSHLRTSLAPVLSAPCLCCCALCLCRSVMRFNAVLGLLWVIRVLSSAIPGACALLGCAYDVSLRFGCAVLVGACAVPRCACAVLGYTCTSLGYICAVILRCACAVLGSTCAFIMRLLCCFEFLSVGVLYLRRACDTLIRCRVPWVFYGRCLRCSWLCACTVMRSVCLCLGYTCAVVLRYACAAVVLR